MMMMQTGLLRRAALRLDGRVLSSCCSRSAASICDGSQHEEASSWRTLSAAAAALVSLGAWQTQRKSHCCGIVGIVGKPPQDVREILLDGLTVLKNRGLDSAGMATMAATGDSMTIIKYGSREDDGTDCIELVRNTSQQQCAQTLGMPHTVGMAHTRWATHGAKTDANAHPHVDASGQIAVVHNGTIYNASELRRELQAQGMTFYSQTDSEVIAKLIGYYYQALVADENKADDANLLKQATTQAMDRCVGTWGLVVMCSKTPDALVVACHGSPLVLGVDQDRTFVASEPEAVSRHARNLIPLRHGEIAILSANPRAWDMSRQQEAVVTQQESEEQQSSPDPYPHWTLKEICEQPESIARALSFGSRLGGSQVLLGGLDRSLARLQKLKYLVLTGCGTSLYAARYGERLMRHLASVDNVTTIDANELHDNDYPGSKSNGDKQETGLIAISQSGETRDVARAVQDAMDRGITVMSVVNVVGSSIARMTKLGVYCHAGRENAVASTKAFTCQVTVLALIALWFRQIRETTPSIETTSLKEALMRLPLSFGMAIKTRDECRAIAEKLKDKEHCFVLGKGYGEPVAMEGSMKLKELSYIHAEGYSGGALKHGPFALIDDDKSGKFGATPVIMIILDDKHAHHMRTAAEEVKARGAELIIITDKRELADGLADNPIVIPSNGPLTALGAVLPLQMIAYELALIRGINPDAPRNLAKVVLVD